MKAVVLSGTRGEVHVDEIPPPQLQRGQVLVHNLFSLLSAGTERARLAAGQQHFLAQVRGRPDRARQVLDAVRRVGPMETYRMVSERLEAPTLLGYSSAGTVLDLATDTRDVRKGQLVACAGAGYANHAEIISVPHNLVVPVPDGVPAQDAAFATVGAVALHGIHQTGCPPGSRVLVIGLGLVGQLTIRILRTYGYDAIGIDTSADALDLAAKAGVPVFSRSDETLDRNVRERWGGGGAEAVILTAATTASDPVEVAGELAADRATVVIVGDVGVVPPRASYYGKELSVVYSRSYGPGRYDEAFEERGIDYPAGYVPWTEKRNIAEFLRLLRVGALDVTELDPQLFSIDDAPRAYATLQEGDEGRRAVAVLLSYRPVTVASERPTIVSKRASRSKVKIAAIGAGSFATQALFPHLRRRRDTTLTWLSTAHGLTAASQARRWGFADALSVEEGLAQDVDAVMVLTRHDSHAEFSARVLSSGAALFCEKPLGLTEDELDAVATAWLAAKTVGVVGFNRRFAPAVKFAQTTVAGSGPLQLSYRVFAGPLPDGHWYRDPAQGGRIVGEVCHFVDTAGCLIGGRPVAVVASSQTRDPVAAENVSALIEYDDGSTATIIYCGATPAGAPKELIEIAGDDIAVRIDDFSEGIAWGHKKDVQHWRGSPKGHAEEIDAFVRAVKGERVPETDFVGALMSSLVTAKITESIATGGTRCAVTSDREGLVQALDLARGGRSSV